jgi:hypothetical protein
MKVQSCRDLKSELFERAAERYGEVVTFYRAKKATKDSIVKVRKPDFLALGIAPSRDGKSPRLAVRVAKGKSNYQRARKLLAEAKIPESEIDFVSGVEYKAQQEILRIGWTGAHPNLCRGTLGAIVQDDHNTLFILSNNHVLTNTQTAARGDPIVQPSRCDASGVVVGHLDWWEPLEAGTHDVALAKVHGASLKRIDALKVRGTSKPIDPRPISDRDGATNVFKAGARSAVTRGRVTAYDIENERVTYRKPDGSTFQVIFEDTLLIEIERDNPNLKFSEEGDSGAVVFEQDSVRPYALLFAGTTKQGMHKTLASFMPDVLQHAGVSLVAVAHPPVPS